MDLQASSPLERRFRSEKREGRQADRTTVSGEDDRTAVKETVQVVGLIRRDLVPNEQIYQAVRVHHYTLREVGDHVGLLYSTISVIAKRVHEKMES
jgi:hypothetical protein